MFQFSVFYFLQFSFKSLFVITCVRRCCLATLEREKEKKRKPRESREERKREERKQGAKEEEEEGQGGGKVFSPSINKFHCIAEGRKIY